MVPASALRLLPTALRGLVERALVDPFECEEAIAAVERHLARQGRCPCALFVLAALVFRDAELVLSEMLNASTRALALIEEAYVRGAPQTLEILELEARCRLTIESERARETKLLRRATNGQARVGEIVELAHRM